MKTLRNIRRLQFLFGKVVICLLNWMLSGTVCIAAQTQSAVVTDNPRDFTFFLFSDIHLGAENLKAKPPVTKADSLARVKANLEAMRNLVGQPYPEKPAFSPIKPGTIAAPRALIILGDVTDGHKDPVERQEQIQTFDRLFPVSGISFGGKEIPVFTCAGNHDGEPAGPQRQGLLTRNRQLAQAGYISATSSNGVHFAMNWSGVHFVCLNLYPADAPDAETPFKFGKIGPGSWNDPQGALSFLRDYLVHQVSNSGEPVVLMQHYGFDSFSLNDWNWWTPKQRRILYDLLKDYNVAAFLHGHNHHAEHYRWPDPKRHAADLNLFYGGQVPANPRQYDVLSCGNVCWVIRVRGNQLIAAHFKGPGWNTDPAAVLVKSLKP